MGAVIKFNENVYFVVFSIIIYLHLINYIIIHKSSPLTFWQGFICMSYEQAQQI